MKGDVTGVILVGGKSSRIGRDKAFPNVNAMEECERLPREGRNDR